MPYDVRLADRVRRLVRPTRDLSEREQFGGIAFLINGSVACGVIGHDLLVRVGPAKHEEAIKAKGARPFSLTGRPSRGWIIVGSAAVKGDVDLKRWVALGLDFAKTLPPK